MCADPSAVVMPTPGHVILQCDDTTYYPAPNGTIWQARRRARRRLCHVASPHPPPPHTQRLSPATFLQVTSTDYGKTWQPRVNVSAQIGLRGIHLGTAGAGATGGRAPPTRLHPGPLLVTSLSLLRSRAGVIKKLPSGIDRVIFAAYYKPTPAHMVTLVRSMTDVIGTRRLSFRQRAERNALIPPLF